MDLESAEIYTINQAHPSFYIKNIHDIIRTFEEIDLNEDTPLDTEAT